MEAAATPAKQPLDRNVILALVAMGLAVLVLANDFTALSVALPNIEHDFDAGVSTVQWVINGYALVFGVLIVTGGRLADMFGRKEVFLVGSAIFALFSVLGGLAPNIGVLIGCRALMGIGGAMMWPAILGMTFAALPEDRAGLAGGFILGVAGLGNAIGPLFGGFLTDAFGWEWIFFVNLPIAAFGALVTWKFIHQPKEGTTERIDYLGITTLSLSLVSLLVALDEVTDLGWGNPQIVALLVGFVVLLVAFVFVERRAGEHALVPADVMRNRNFTAACLAVLLMSATFFAALIYAPQYMSKILHYSPLKAGAGLLPMMLTFGVVSFVAGNLYDKMRPKLVLTFGATCITAGIFLLSLIQPGDTYVNLIPGLAILGIGIGSFYSTVTTAGVTALDESRASLAGGIVYMAQIAGGSVGLGLTTTIFTTGQRDDLKEKLHETAHLSGHDVSVIHGILAGTASGKDALASVPVEARGTVLDLVRDSFVAGLQDAFRVDAALAFVGLVVTVLFVGGTVHRPKLHELPHRLRAHL